MQLYKSLTFGPYAPSPLRKSATFINEQYRSVADAARTRPYASLLVWGGAVFFALSFFAFLFSLPPGKVTADGPIASTPIAAPTSNARPLEVHIANNGLVLLRSARVLSVNSDTITVATIWGEVDFTWVVRTDSRRYEAHTFGTNFLDRNGDTISLSEVRVGDLVTVTGTLDSSAHNPTIDADSVRTLQ